MTPLNPILPPENNNLQDKVYLLVTAFLAEERRKEREEEERNWQAQLTSYPFLWMPRMEMLLLEEIEPPLLQATLTPRITGINETPEISRPIEQMQSVVEKNFKQIKVTSPEKANFLTEEELAHLKKCDESLYNCYQKTYKDYQEILEEKCPITLTSPLEYLKNGKNDQPFVIVKFKLDQNKAKAAVYDYNALVKWISISGKAILPHNRMKVNFDDIIINEIYFNPDKHETNDEILVELINKAQNILSVDNGINRTPDNNQTLNNKVELNSFGFFCKNPEDEKFKEEKTKEDRMENTLVKKL